MTTTTEEYQYVGFWLRVFSGAIDSILIAIITRSLVFLLVFLSSGITEMTLTIVGIVMFFIHTVLPIGMIIWFWSRYQATPGKMLISAKIVDVKTGGKPSLRALIIRFLGYFPAYLILFLGVIWVGFDPKKQGWHDKMAGTLVIKR